MNESVAKSQIKSFESPGYVNFHGTHRNVHYGRNLAVGQIVSPVQEEGRPLAFWQLVNSMLYRANLLAPTSCVFRIVGVLNAVY